MLLEKVRRGFFTGREQLKRVLKSTGVSRDNSDLGPWIWECKWVCKNIYSVEDMY